jgi:hypothetical protein
VFRCEGCNSSVARGEKPGASKPWGLCRIVWRRALGLEMLLALPLATLAQSPGQLPDPAHLPDSTFSGTTGTGIQDTVAEARRLRQLNEARQKSMVADANKLLKLAAELNAEMAASNADTVTPAQLRKVAEIERLARNVREKMAMSVRVTAAFPEMSPSQAH